MFLDDVITYGPKFIISLLISSTIVGAFTATVYFGGPIVGTVMGVILILGLLGMYAYTWWTFLRHTPIPNSTNPTQIPLQDTGPIEWGNNTIPGEGEEVRPAPSGGSVECGGNATV
jgi:hypothetical protein